MLMKESTLLLHDGNVGKAEGIHLTSARWWLWRKRSCSPRLPHCPRAPGERPRVWDYYHPTTSGALTGSSR
jgi:hypothetical protein